MSTSAGVYKFCTPLPNGEGKSLISPQKNKAHENDFHHPASLIYSILRRYTALNCINVLVNNCVGFSLSPFYGTQKVIAYDYPMKCEVIIT